MYFQVSVPQTGQLALDLMCGVYQASRCSPTKWFTYMGDKDGNPYVPFQISYVQHQTNTTDKGISPLNPTTIPCNKAVNVSCMLLHPTKIIKSI